MDKQNIKELFFLGSLYIYSQLYAFSVPIQKEPGKWASIKFMACWMVKQKLSH